VKIMHWRRFVTKRFSIKVEYSGPQTPQRHGKVERKFQTLYGRIRACLLMPAKRVILVKSCKLNVLLLLHSTRI
jgi:hypothetical protein